MSYRLFCLGNLEYNSIPENRVKVSIEMGRRLGDKELEETTLFLILETG